MKYLVSSAIIVVLLAGPLMQGCKKEEAPPPAPAKTPSPAPAVAAPTPASAAPTPSPVATPAASASPAQDTAAKEAQASLDKIAGLIKDGKLAEAEQELKALEAKSSSLAPETQAKIKAARVSLDGAKTVANQTVLDKIMALIQDGKLDDAQKLLNDLKANSASLPQSIQDKIKAADAALAAKKAAGGVTVPKLPG